MNPVLLIALLGGALYFGRKIAAGKKLQFYPSGFRWENKKLFFVLEVVNPSLTELKINNVFAQVYNGTTEVGRTLLSEPIVIIANGSTKISLPIKLNAINAITTGIQIANGTVTELTVNGTANSEGINVPFQQLLPLQIV